MFQQEITPLQCRDTALAFAFLALIVWFFTQNVYFIYGCMALLLWAMVWPSSFKWPAKLWFGFSHVLGFFMSKLLLSIIYIVILMPVAMVRHMMGKDAMRLRQWKAGEGSAFVVREHTYSKEDLQQPY